MKANFENEQKGNYADMLEERMLQKSEEKEPVNIVVEKEEQVSVELKYDIRAHFDSVMGVHYVQKHDVLASISADC